MKSAQPNKPRIDGDAAADDLDELFANMAEINATSRSGERNRRARENVAETERQRYAGRRAQDPLHLADGAGRVLPGRTWDTVPSDIESERKVDGWTVLNR
ncbi:hypothetical protein [Nocardia pneumoniae]|uniref:hypothetical protein n=1 Tax=Nocardia pneumoniae TaxID=228601 RepID=UPI0002D8B72C|nr:hypothetical protein [Nocardia pneumoniae]